MAKLHELIAVEDSLRKAAEKLQTESAKTLNKDHLFKGEVRTLEIFSGDPTEKAEEGTEVTKLESTVDENLSYIIPYIARYWDAVLQKDQTNQTAKADIVVNGTALTPELPATFLLGMEQKLAELRKVFMAQPTLPPGERWELDQQERPGVFRGMDTKWSMKTKKDIEFREVAPPTKEHPAQIAQVPQTKNIGKYTVEKTCGMLTPLEKAQRISRLDELLRAVKKARMRANNAAVVKGQVGTRLLDFVLTGQ